MKLPGIQYGRTPNLAMLPVDAPLREAQAMGKIVDSITKAAEGVLAAENMVNDAATTAQFQTMMAEINAQTTARRSYHYSDLDELGVSYPDKYGEGKIEVVPAYLVSTNVYRTLAEKTYNDALSSASAKGREAISKIYGRMYEKGIQGVMTFAVEEAANQQRIKLNDAFETNVMSGNATAATMVAETAKQTGIWSAEEYEKRMRDLPARVAQGQYLRALEANDNIEMLQVLQNNIVNDPALPFDKRNALYKQYDSKIAAMERKREGELKEQKDRESYNTYLAASEAIMTSGPLPWDEITQVAATMSRVDGKAVMTLNRLAEEKGAKTDPQMHMDLTMMVNQIALPREGTTLFQRKEAAMNAIMEAAGIDPTTGERVGPSKLSTEDFNTLWNRVKQQSEIIVSDRNVSTVADNIWQILVGGSKTIMTRALGNGPEVVNASQAELDLYKAAMEQGPAFDPFKWWEENKSVYSMRGLVNNERHIMESRLQSYIIKSGDLYDVEATMRAVRAAVKSGKVTVSDDQIVEFERAINSRNRLIEASREAVKR